MLVYLATGIVVSMPVPANVGTWISTAGDENVLCSYGDCCSTATLFYLSVVLWRSAYSGGELRVAWVGAFCVVGKCVDSRHFWLLGELRRHCLTRVYVCIYVCIYTGCLC